MMPKLVYLVALLWLLTACQQSPVRDEPSHRSRVTIGSHVILHQALTVPRGQARVFL